MVPPVTGGEVYNMYTSGLTCDRWRLVLCIQVVLPVTGGERCTMYTSGPTCDWRRGVHYVHKLSYL